ncbi:MAG: response regulator transcription factor [Elainellaceae cyanobacterium]
MMQSNLELAARFQFQNAAGSHFSSRVINILTVVGETDATKRLLAELGLAGYRLRVVRDGIDGFLAGTGSCYDLVILNWSLPRLSGLELCQRLRSIKSRLPIMMLLQQGSAMNCAAALDAGADDCIAPDAEQIEILARIRACLRRHLEQQSEAICYDNLTLNCRTREVYRDNSLIRLTAREFDLLEYLMRHRHQVLTRAQILEEVWGHDFMGESNIIEVYIRYLRLKLEANRQPRLIQTIRYVGYVLRSQITCGASPELVD